MRIFIPSIAYCWTAEDKQVIGNGFLPFYTSLEDLELNYGAIEYYEIDIPNAYMPDKKANPPFENGFSLN